MRTTSQQAEETVSRDHVTEAENFELIDAHVDEEDAIVDMARDLHIATPAVANAIEEISSADSECEPEKFEDQGRQPGRGGPRDHPHHHHPHHKHGHGPPPHDRGHGRFGHHRAHSPPDWAPFKDDMMGHRGPAGRGMAGRGRGLGGRGRHGHDHHGRPPPPRHFGRRGPPSRDFEAPPDHPGSDSHSPPPPDAPGPHGKCSHCPRGPHFGHDEHQPFQNSGDMPPSPPPFGQDPSGMPRGGPRGIPFPGSDRMLPPHPHHHRGPPHGHYATYLPPPPDLADCFASYQERDTSPVETGFHPRGMQAHPPFGGPRSGMGHPRHHGGPRLGAFGPPPHAISGFDHRYRDERHHSRGGRGHQHHFDSHHFADRGFRREIPA